ncbi:hypothetical protein D2Q93_14600 [Alicyclobacillaceae bacterium I2511]|nr:hypothetical protein D2Q93_14600 [Alicyclobacillaceae bacterium I2511]
MEEHMNLKHISLLSVVSFSVLALVGCAQTPGTQRNQSTSNASVNKSETNDSPPSAGAVIPPSRQYLNAVVKEEEGKTALYNFQFCYIKQLTPTLSVCLYIFNKNRKTLFNEALVSKENGQWQVPFSATASPIENSFPLTVMDLNGSYGGKVIGNTTVGSTPYQIIGGFISDPAISTVELTDLSGVETRTLPIVVIGNLKMYAYAQVMPTQHIQGWQVRTYDKFGSMISPSSVYSGPMDSGSRKGFA